MHLYLIGYRGSGKSTVGPKVAQLLNREWLDTDAVIQQEAGCSIAEMFADSGEAEFRRRERELLSRLASASQPGAVVSLGGGAPLSQPNRDAMADSGLTVWLTAPPAILHQRIAGDQATHQQRPNLTEQGGIAEIVEVLGQREPVYRLCADSEVAAGELSPEIVARTIVDWWKTQAIH